MHPIISFRLVLVPIMIAFVEGCSLSRPMRVAPPPWSQTAISKVITDKIQAVDPNLNIGIKIIDMANNQPIYIKNDYSYYTPASLTKLVSLLGLLNYFKQPFRNAIYLSQDEDRYFLSIYDPNFLTQDLEKLSATLVKKKIRLDQLDIMQQDFSLPPIVLNRAVNDLNYDYGAPITQVHINKNACSLIGSSTGVGEKIAVNTGLFFPYELHVEATTIPADPAYAEIPLNVVFEGKKCFVKGNLRVGQSTETIKLAIPVEDNYNYVKAMIQHCLGDIAVSVMEDRDKGGAKEIVSQDKLYTDVAAVALKRSDNFIADYVVASFATQEKQSTWNDATQHLKARVEERWNVAITKSQMDDGSGLSRRNLFTVNQMSDFLNAVAKSPHFNDIQNLMACSQQAEGTTLAGRFPKDMRVYAKTATLAGVSNLAGYVYPKDNKLPYSFVITMNNFYGSPEKYRTLQNDIVKLFE